MPSPPIQLFLTTIASQASLRQRQEYILRILQVRKIPFTSYDLASDEAAKRLWKRKAPAGRQELPGILVGGRCPGTFSEFEEAVEYSELDTFLRLKEEWDPDLEGAGILPAQPIGVPGAVTPSQMTNHKPSFAPTPSPLKNKDAKEYDLGEELSGFGLQGVKVSDDELRDLIEQLGLGGDDAADLVIGLGGERKSSKEESKSVQSSGDSVSPGKELTKEETGTEKDKGKKDDKEEEHPEGKEGKEV